MRVIHARRASQVSFLLLFLALAVLTAYGERPWQMRGWPVGLFLELDPLAAFATALATGVVWGGMIWAVLTVAVTALLGRVFCGWVCPFGTLHQAVGWVGRRFGIGPSVRYSPAQSFKYYVLAFLLATAGMDAVLAASRLAHEHPVPALASLLALGAVAFAAVRRAGAAGARVAVVAGTVALLVAFGGRVLRQDDALTSSVLVGLLDPIPFLTRATDTVVLPLLDRSVGVLFATPRRTHGGWLIGGLLVAALLANLWRTRFWCRFVCPLGALLGLVAHSAPWRIAKAGGCSACNRCDGACEGGAEPSRVIRHAECVMCASCLDGCDEGVMTWRAAPSEGGERALPDVSRRGVVASLGAGMVAVPLLRLGGAISSDWPAGQVRPPGALPEPEFLDRCIRCGQCMRVCPTGTIQPAGPEAGVEALWTPVLNARIGTSGCQPNCVACGRVCPTGAIRRFGLDEKLGRGEFEADGPIRVGTAFVDRGRCLPWAFDLPCIVCQEACPTSPKAIRLSDRTVTDADRGEVVLRRPVVDPALCNGCGICEHECPVSGLRAIRVTAENESRSRDRRLLPGTSRPSSRSG
jgi:polyferredoxin